MNLMLTIHVRDKAQEHLDVEPQNGIYSHQPTVHRKVSKKRGENVDIQAGKWPVVCWIAASSFFRQLAQLHMCQRSSMR